MLHGLLGQRVFYLLISDACLGPQASRASPRLGFIFCGANRSRPRTKEKPRCFAERGSSRLSQPSELDQR